MFNICLRNKCVIKDYLFNHSKDTILPIYIIMQIKLIIHCCNTVDRTSYSDRDIFIFFNHGPNAWEAKKTTICNIKSVQKLSTRILKLHKLQKESSLYLFVKGFLKSFCFDDDIDVFYDKQSAQKLVHNTVFNTEPSILIRPLILVDKYSSAKISNMIV